MKIERSQVTKLVITDAPRLDPITVFLEDIEPRKGRITIQCYDKAWTAYWGGMGECTIAHFFTTVSPDYIAGNLSVGIRRTVYNPHDAEQFCKDYVCKERRKRDLNADDARELFNDIDMESFDDDAWTNADLFRRLFGDEWWYALPQSPNPEYQYLCRIIEAVQVALRQTESQPEPA